MIRICENCGRAFEAKFKNKVYCTKKCAQESYRERKRDEKVKEEKKCAVCGEVFIADRENAVCCSKHCREIRIKLQKSAREQQLQERQKQKKKTNTQKLIEDAKKAREAGMTYGQWQAKQYAERERR